ncbi:hypothetical protein [Xylocopilactobacillus apicola]|uniref:Uncharacterized protein n=1 Tax=Xylocopilactobacillus apicola TaxID=2932184 RepID=A0AAU9DWS4_9LACO|nr:hypothetical protein [Xylocopilactobacillus apicola]BDR58488.1 hypothetical protein XA3_09290 [Xylocopilactobacillus apicola]
MTELHSSERLIINQLLDHNVFTSSITPELTKTTLRAITVLKRPLVQQRINKYLQDLLGIIPENYQENLLFLVNKEQLPPETVHVLLATLKAVINLPELQGVDGDRVVSTQKIIQLVHSEVTELRESEIAKQITNLFVDRFALFKPELPEEIIKDSNEELIEYWDISPDFNYIAQCLVNLLLKQDEEYKLNDLQRVNRFLLENKYLDSKQSHDLWSIFISNKDLIAQKWAQLKRFDLECGDDYALLLDRSRRTSSSKAFMTAILVAQSLTAGLPKSRLTLLIQQTAKQYFPHFQISISEVRRLLFEQALATQNNGFIIATPVVNRFHVKLSN